jgi:hypothetical protein
MTRAAKAAIVAFGEIKKAYEYDTTNWRLREEVCRSLEICKRLYPAPRQVSPKFVGRDWPYTKTFSSYGHEEEMYTKLADAIRWYDVDEWPAEALGVTSEEQRRSRRNELLGEAIVALTRHLVSR